MKLYEGRHLGKRRLKKRLRPWTLKSLREHANVKVGDLVTTCEGVNRPITKIRLEWRTIGRRRMLVGRIYETAGGAHDYTNCCEYPAQTKQQIVEDWLYWAKPENRKENFWFLRIADALVTGEDLFNDDGTPNARFDEIKSQAND